MTTRQASHENKIHSIGRICFGCVSSTPMPSMSLAIPFLSLPLEVVPLLLIFIPATLAIFFTAMSEGYKGVGVLLKKLTQWRIGFQWYLIAFGMSFGFTSCNQCAGIFAPNHHISLHHCIFPLGNMCDHCHLYHRSCTYGGTWLERLCLLKRYRTRQLALSSALIIGIPWGILHLGLTFPGQMEVLYILDVDDSILYSKSL